VKIAREMLAKSSCSYLHLKKTPIKLFGRSNEMNKKHMPKASITFILTNKLNNYSIHMPKASKPWLNNVISSCITITWKMTLWNLVGLLSCLPAQADDSHCCWCSGKTTAAAAAAVPTQSKKRWWSSCYPCQHEAEKRNYGKCRQFQKEKNNIKKIVSFFRSWNFEQKK